MIHQVEVRSAAARATRPTRWMLRAFLGVAFGVLATQSFASGAWTYVAPLATGRSHHVVAENNGIVYAVGGVRSNASGNGLIALATLEAYDPANDTWTFRAPMLTPRHNAAGAFLDGILYVVGGQDSVTGLPIDTVEAYDPATDTWTTKPPLLAARYAPGVAVVDDVLYVVGGVGAGSACSSWGGGQSVLATVEAYDSAADTWTSKASMPTARQSPGAGVVDGLLYLVGGQGCDHATSRYATNEAYDPATDTWTTLAPMSVARVGVGVAVRNGLLYVFAGAGPSPYPIFASVEAYDPTAGTWTSQPSLSTARYFLGACVASGTLYAVGGTAYAGGSTVGWEIASVEVLASDSNADPVAAAGADQTLDATSAAGAEVTLDGADSSDSDGDPVTFQWNVPIGIVLDDPTSATPTGTFPLGVHMVTLTVSDGQGGLDTDDVVITVEDAAPPQALCTTDIAALWPPNHAMVDVEVRIVATDFFTDPADLVLASVKLTSDEPDDAAGNGDGKTTGDVDGSDGFAAPIDVTASFTFDPTSGSFVGTVTLRAERSGSGDGRSYGIQAVIEDPSGNATSTSCVVVVPHSRGR